MTAVLNNNDTVNEIILTMALELSNKTWRLGSGQGKKVRQVTIAYMDVGKERELGAEALPPPVSG